MALNASGPISLAGSTTGQSIAVELGLSPTAQISLNDAAVRGLAGVPSGAIVMPTNFYGKSNIVYMQATGGTVTTSGNYKIHRFTGNGTFNVTTAPAGGGDAETEILVVAGAGGGGNDRGGGGGAGGTIYQTAYTGFSATGNYTVTIGGGGAGSPSEGVRAGNGSNSVLGAVTATGGGSGGGGDGSDSFGSRRNGRNGGSGGGAKTGGTRGTGIAGQGNDGATGDAGGGGGAGAAGTAGNPSPQAAGFTSSISGSSVTYARGGRGTSSNGGAGPVGGANTGDGGGGGAFSGGQQPGGAGGSGVVVIKYRFQ
jgi:hypothetical protein